MAKKLLVMAVTLMLCSGLFAGCGDRKNFVVSYDKIGGFGSKQVDDGETFSTLEMVNSLQELKDLCGEWGNPAFEESSEYYSSEISQKIRSYDESYFSEKMLIVYSFLRGHYKETRIDSIAVDGEKLIVNAHYKDKKGTFSSESFSWLMLIEVSKSETVGATYIEVHQK